MGGVLPFTMVKIQETSERSTEDLSLLSMVIIALIYTVGSFLTRGANMQKYSYRRNPHRRTVELFGGLLVLRQQSVPSSHGRLLCSGFWGMSRHINYFGESLQAVALALPAWLHFQSKDDSRALSYVSWLYPLYYVALFIPRQLDDEELMRQKYGATVMDEYCQLVPYRMVPGLY